MALSSAAHGSPGPESVRAASLRPESIRTITPESTPASSADPSVQPASAAKHTNIKSFVGTFSPFGKHRLLPEIAIEVNSVAMVEVAARPRPGERQRTRSAWV